MSEDLYGDLGVDKDADAASIKRAYRKKAQRAHPDKKGGSDEEFKKVQRAWLVLSDDAKRKRYDETGSAEEQRAPKDEWAEAREIAAGIFLQKVREAEDVECSDLIAEAREMVSKQLVSNSIESARLGVEIKKRSKALKRLKHKSKEGAPDLLKQALEAAIASIERARETLAKDHETGKRVIEVLAQYEYEAAPRKPEEIVLGGVRYTWR